MSQNYTEEFKKQIIRLHLEEGRTINSLHQEYGVSKASVSKWCNIFSQECQNKAISNNDYSNEAELMKEIRRLKQQHAEDQKEIAFLKKAAAFFAKEID